MIFLSLETKINQEEQESRHSQFYGVIGEDEELKLEVTYLQVSEKKSILPMILKVSLEMERRKRLKTTAKK